MTIQPGSADSDRRARDDADGHGTGHDHGTGQGAGRNAGTDISGEIQRWLIRSGARNMRRELTGQFRRTFSRDQDNVWGVATTEPPPGASGEAPECAWCPVCRAARRIRESRPNVGGQLAGAGDVVASAVQEALSALDSVLATGPRKERERGFPADRFPADRFPADRFPVAGTRPEPTDHEPDDRD
jgi:hypothetical protein